MVRPARDPVEIQFYLWTLQTIKTQVLLQNTKVQRKRTHWLIILRSVWRRSHMLSYPQSKLKRNKRHTYVTFRFESCVHRSNVVKAVDYFILLLFNLRPNLIWVRGDKGGGERKQMAAPTGPITLLLMCMIILCGLIAGKCAHLQWMENGKR